MVDGETVTDPNLVLRDGSELVYHRLPWKEPDAPYLLEVLYEDDGMIALNKPAGLQVLSGGLFQQRTVLTQLQWHANKNSTSPGQELHPVPVHRLGRGTSEPFFLSQATWMWTKPNNSAYELIFGNYKLTRDKVNSPTRKLEMHSELGVERRITKIYRALVKGILDMSEVVIDQPIGTMRYPGVARGLYVALPSGKPALSKVRVLERNVKKDQTLVQVDIFDARNGKLVMSSRRKPSLVHIYVAEALMMPDKSEHA
ncbi:hypothetical protein Cgig2_029818 [Carnegiea gigantea]|uniref:Pseudouridine synthase RsuA/RluA-like domain-containing protein n=1 Tax=Carnegiea gigantea TaxID=171969 RepID=A0A9Q1GX27_9CARY|nr:hypothetical protein Cgig2_029818 [Carnegiea gigantea]